MASAFNLDELALINPARFVSDGYPHEAWTHLRREAPVCGRLARAVLGAENI